MSLRHALLALFTARPMTGYEVYRQYLGSADFVWHAADSQIYPELRRMEQEGLIEGTSVEHGARSTKTRYTITEQGREAFRQWMNDLLPYPRARDQHHLKAAYFEWAEPEAVRRQLRSHIEHHREQIRLWRNLLDAIEAGGPESPLAARLALLAEEEHPRVIAYKRFAYEGMIARGRAEIDWAEAGLELVDRLEADRGSSS